MNLPAVLDFRRPIVRGVETGNQGADEPRRALAGAIEAAAEAGRAVSAARAAAERGQAGVDAARAGLVPFDGLDARVAGFHAAAARAGEANGRAALPPDLIEARRDRAAAQQDLADAEAAAGLLAADLAAAEAAAEAARLVVRRAIAVVCTAEAGLIVAAIRAAERQAADLRNALTGFGSDWTPLDAPLPIEITSVLREAQHPLLLDLHGYGWKSPSRLDWPAFRAALAADADAVLEPSSDPGSGR